MSPTLLIIGSGAHGRISAETAQLLGFNVLGFADDDAARHGKMSGNYQILGDWKALVADYYFVAVGINTHRERIFHELIASGKQVPSLIHPFSYVSPQAKISTGAIILAGVVIQAGAIIQENVIANVHSTVDHDAVVGAHSQLAPGSVVCSFGQVQRGELLPPGSVRLREKKV